MLSFQSRLKLSGAVVSCQPRGKLPTCSQPDGGGAQAEDGGTGRLHGAQAGVLTSHLSC